MEHSTRMLGGFAYIGLIVFSILSIIPYVGVLFWFLSLGAAVCVLVAFVQAGNQLGRPDVKSSIVTAIVLYIIAVALFMFIVAVGIAALIGAGLTNSGAGAATGFAAFGVSALIGGIIGWILCIVAAWFWYKASRVLAEATGASLFQPGGLLLFIGAILLIVGIGAILMFIGEILQAIAFFNAPEKRAMTPGTAT